MLLLVLTRKVNSASVAAVMPDKSVLTHASGAAFGQVQGQQRENLGLGLVSKVLSISPFMLL